MTDLLSVLLLSSAFFIPLVAGIYFAGKGRW